MTSYNPYSVGSCDSPPISFLYLTTLAGTPAAIA